MYQERISQTELKRTDTTRTHGCSHRYISLQRGQPLLRRDLFASQPFHLVLAFALLTPKHLRTMYQDIRHCKDVAHKIERLFFRITVNWQQHFSTQLKLNSFHRKHRNHEKTSSIPSRLRHETADIESRIFCWSQIHSKKIISLMVRKYQFNEFYRLNITV